MYREVGCQDINVLSVQICMISIYFASFKLIGDTACEVGFTKTRTDCTSATNQFVDEEHSLVLLSMIQWFNVNMTRAIDPASSSLHASGAMSSPLML